MRLKKGIPKFFPREVRIAGVASLLLFAGAGRCAAQDIIAYGRECAKKVAPIPAFDCLDEKKGSVVPITVNGVTPSKYEPQMTCDRPSLFYQAGEKTDGHCVPDTRVLVLQDDKKAQISAVCRQKEIRDASSPLFDEIDVISHNLETGSTCWFQALAQPPLSPARGLNGRRVPPPDEVTPPAGQPSAKKFWNSPEQTAKADCVSCHDSDPFMYSPFIAQTGKLPADPLGKYANDIGAPFQKWKKPFSLSTRGNTCTSCHRIGSFATCQHTVAESVGKTASPGSDDWAQRYPNSHWMPPGNSYTQAQWDVIYRQSLEKIGQCCVDPSRPGCQVMPIRGSK